MTRIPAIKKTLTKAQSHRGELDQKLLEGGPSSPLSAFRFDLFLFLRVSAPPCEPPFRFPSASLRLCARSLFCSPFAAYHSSSVLSVSFDSLAPARLALRANLRMLYLAFP